MTMMVSEIYDAFISAKAEEPKARAAATALAVTDKRSDERHADLREDNQKMRTEMVALRGEIVLVRWMLTFLIGLAIAITFRVFTT